MALQLCFDILRLRIDKDFNLNEIINQTLLANALKDIKLIYRGLSIKNLENFPLSFLLKCIIKDKAYLNAIH